jgi:acyl-CoA synthetase (AMP-forming)/AMP-acid ligase II
MIRTELIASVGQLIRRHARQRPEKPAFQDSHKVITYAELAVATAKLAGYLQDQGVKPGGRVAVLLPNSVDWVISCLAIARAGAVSVPINFDATEAEIRYRLDDAGCSAAITTAQQAALLARLQTQLPELASMVSVGSAPEVGSASFEQVLAGDWSAPLDLEALDEPGFIVYTSGTTGKPKGVVLTPRGMFWVTAACWAPIAGLAESDTVLSALPLYHSYALNLTVLSVLAVGASEYILEKFSTQELTAQLQTGRYTVVPGVPTVFHYLLESSRNQGVTKLPGVRLCISAGAILPAALNRDFEAHFGIQLLDGYGITETSTMVTMNWRDSPRVMGSCGLSLPGLSTRIVSSADGHDVATGEEGELIIRGPNVMKGYLNKPAETAAALKDGWYHTGDLARSDANGFITITGRLKELIIRGGQNIAPAEVEEAIGSFDSVLECAVVGAPHPQLGEVVVAFVVPRPGHTVDGEALLSHCRTQMSAYKVPQSVHLVDTIPRTGSGKILRFKLREQLDAPSSAQ